MEIEIYENIAPIDNMDEKMKCYRESCTLEKAMKEKHGDVSMPWSVSCMNNVRDGLNDALITTKMMIAENVQKVKDENVLAINDVLYAVIGNHGIGFHAKSDY